MYIVRWDDYTGQNHKRSFEHLEDAQMEAIALLSNSMVQWVYRIEQKSAPSGGNDT